MYGLVWLLAFFTPIFIGCIIWSYDLDQVVFCGFASASLTMVCCAVEYCVSARLVDGGSA